MNQQDSEHFPEMSGGTFLFLFYRAAEILVSLLGLVLKKLSMVARTFNGSENKMA